MRADAKQSIFFRCYQMNALLNRLRDENVEIGKLKDIQELNKEANKRRK